MKLKDLNNEEKASPITEEKYRRKKNPTISCLLCEFTAKTQKHMDKHAFEAHADNRLCAQVRFILLFFVVVVRLKVLSKRHYSIPLCTMRHCTA